ncbi:carbohydrate kinase family protein [Actinacidiphila acidipaludis]|uniref:Carbohydrate kinase n=1 Tax=Actinacidiphila acidipaludis TaxID=2873382 RepID=A0ABS7QBY9_9ACTN|nr:carbohydrate kinase [Streptomyces acidipaludis]MBY8879960.1 carbohydrate kinase [Streptomyces acidipaludis]
MQASPQVTVLGECVADLLAEQDDGEAGLTLRMLPGGGPANTAVGLARLGTPSRLLARVSGDLFGRRIRAHLLSSGVDLSDAVAAREPSTLAIADIDPEGQAAYTFHARGTADWQWTGAELAAAGVGRSACVHSGSLALTLDPGGAAVEDFLAAARDRATVSIDPNIRTSLVDAEHYRRRLPGWCALADILRLSEDDLRELRPSSELGAACADLHRAGARLVVVTRGADGAVVSLDGARATIPGVAVDVVDTVGAGDSFTSGLLHRLGVRGLLGGRLDGATLDDVADACRYAARVAALTCSVAGPNPPWAHQVDAVMDDVDSLAAP